MICNLIKKKKQETQEKLLLIPIFIFFQVDFYMGSPFQRGYFPYLAFFIIFLINRLYYYECAEENHGRLKEVFYIFLRIYTGFFKILLTQGFSN
jgi:hypothetical protein